MCCVQKSMEKIRELRYFILSTLTYANNYDLDYAKIIAIAWQMF